MPDEKHDDPIKSNHRPRPKVWCSLEGRRQGMGPVLGSVQRPRGPKFRLDGNERQASSAYVPPYRCRMERSERRRRCERSEWVSSEPRGDDPELGSRQVKQSPKRHGNISRSTGRKKSEEKSRLRKLFLRDYERCPRRSTGRKVIEEKSRLQKTFSIDSGWCPRRSTGRKKSEEKSRLFPEFSAFS